MTDSLVVSDPSGDFTLDAGLVAEGFGWSVAELHDHMRRGLVSSLVERGEGEDAGLWRLSMRCGNRRWQTIVSQDGVIRHRDVAFTHSRHRI